MRVGGRLKKLGEHPVTSGGGRYEDIRALLDRRCDMIGQSRTKDADAMPLGLKGPFALGSLPGALRGDRKNGEL